MDSAHSIIPFSGSKSKASVERLSYIDARVPRLDNTCTRTHSDLRKRVFIHATPPLVNGERETWADVHGPSVHAPTLSLSPFCLPCFFSMNEFTPGTSLLSLRLFVSQPSSPLPSLSRSCSVYIYIYIVCCLLFIILITDFDYT